MATIILDQTLIENLMRISKNAGEAIMKIYETDFHIDIKKDSSPLTKADIASNEIITSSLREIAPNIPILSEESTNVEYKERSKWKKYWLIDPLDGTKEFINRNGQFTVNIALINNNNPIIGVVYAPAANETYWGCYDFGSFHISSENVIKKMEPKYDKNQPLKIVASRSHPSEKLTYFLDNLEEDYQLIEAGSSLKFCLVANGDVDIYPRFGPTSEWDTGAGQAVVKNAGCQVISEDQIELTYNKKKSLLNSFFITANSDLLAEKRYILDLFYKASKI